jgi:hypothetical protein
VATERATPGKCSHCDRCCDRQGACTNRSNTFAQIANVVLPTEKNASSVARGLGRHSGETQRLTIHRGTGEERANSHGEETVGRGLQFHKSRLRLHFVWRSTETLKRTGRDAESPFAAVVHDLCSFALILRYYRQSGPALATLAILNAGIPLRISAIDQTLAANCEHSAVRRGGYWTPC